MEEAKETPTRFMAWAIESYLVWEKDLHDDLHGVDV